MYDTATHVQMVRQRLRQRRRARHARQLARLGGICCALSALLAGTVNALTEFQQTAVLPGPYGSMLLHQGAGGYVLVGVVAFTAAVILTTLCFKYRERTKKHPPEEESKP